MLSTTSKFFPHPSYYVSTCLYIQRSAIANQESLSGLETEMRKLEGLVKELAEEMEFLKKREERFTRTNSSSSALCAISC